MLRLEKGSRQNPIILTFREKPIVFSRELIKAFAIALALHVGAAILFHISPFKIRNPEIILPSSLVNIEIPQGEGQVLTELQDSEPRLRLPTPPRLTFPALPEIPDSSSFTENSLASMEPLLKTSFHEFQISIPQTNTAKARTVTINISGPLSDCPRDSLVVSVSENMKPERQRFAIKVEADKGSIFWYDHLEGSREGRIEAEHLLTALKFHPANSSVILSGEVEIIYD